MKGIVADFVVGAHVDDRLACGLKRAAMDIVVRGMPSITVTIRIRRCEMCGELLADGVGDRRPIALEARKPGAQRACACRRELAANRVIVLQIECAQQRLERQSLNHQRPDDHGERRQHNQIAERKRPW